MSEVTAPAAGPVGTERAAAWEAAHASGFVEACRILGAEIERLRAALTKANEQVERSDTK